MTYNKLFEIKNFSFTYPFQQKGIAFNGEFIINEGDSVLITGPSGSGKSTLLYILKGIIPHHIHGKIEGSIYFDGKNILSEYDNRLEENSILLFQNPYSQAITPKVINELTFTMENYQYTKERMKKALENITNVLNLNGILNREITQLSGGEIQKVVLGSLLSVNPKIILLDEPTAFLDPPTRKQFYKLLKSIVKNHTLIIVDHNIPTDEEFINKIIYINENGTIEFEGGVDKFHKTYFMPKKEKLENTLNDITVHNSIITNAKNIFNRLAVNNLTFNYTKSEPLLNNINFTLEKGEFMTIIGNNGTGKSTILKLLAGILKPKSGEIKYKFNNKILSNRKILYNIAFISQNPENHFFYLTVKDEIENDMKKNNFDITLFNKLIKIFDLNKINMEQSPFTLSEGQKRRLSLIEAITLKRDLIFVDEPTFGQDMDNKYTLYKLFLLMKQTGKTFIAITHDEEFAQLLSDKIFLLENGELKQIK